MCNQNNPNNIVGLLNAYEVVIPGIQRHYVQGADNDKAKETRKNFVDGILEAFEKYKLKEDAGKSDFHLHFIYGTKEGASFKPVDGQQRLTTLWLLARYAVELLSKEDTEGERCKQEWLNTLSRFTYEDRNCAASFCRALTNSFYWADVSFIPDTDDKTAQQIIRTQYWFCDYWMQDSTVSAMLNMLDTIHEQVKKWKEKNSPNGFSAERFLSFLKEKVTFAFQTTGFPEDTYMKMNARGVQLTQWENFKGKFAAKLSGETKKRWEKDIEILSDLYFLRRRSVCNGNDYDKLSNRQRLPDNAFFALACRLAVYEAKKMYSESEEDKKDESLQSVRNAAKFSDWSNDLPYVSFENFKTLFEQEKNGMSIGEFGSQYLKLLRFILKDTNIGKKAPEQIKTYNLLSPYWAQVEKRTLFECMFDPKNDAERDLSWVLFKYLGTCEITNTTCLDDFQKALRIIWNILGNSSRSQARLDEFNKLFCESHTVSLYDEFSNYFYNEESSSFDPNQWFEEKLKAQKRKDNTNWESCISEIESHPLLHGDIIALMNVTAEDLTSGRWEKGLEDFQKDCHCFKELFSQLDSGKCTERIMELLPYGDYAILKADHNNKYIFGTTEQQWDDIFHASNQQTLKKVVPCLGALLNDKRMRVCSYSKLQPGDWRYYFCCPNYKKYFYGNECIKPNLPEKDITGFNWAYANNHGFRIYRMTGTRLSSKYYDFNPFLAAIVEDKSDNENNLVWFYKWRPGSGRIFIGRDEDVSKTQNYISLDIQENSQNAYFEIEYKGKNENVLAELRGLFEYSNVSESADMKVWRMPINLSEGEADLICQGRNLLNELVELYRQSFLICQDDTEGCQSM